MLLRRRRDTWAFRCNAVTCECGCKNKIPMHLMRPYGLLLLSNLLWLKLTEIRRSLHFSHPGTRLSCNLRRLGSIIRSHSRFPGYASMAGRSGCLATYRCQCCYNSGILLLRAAYYTVRTMRRHGTRSPPST